jgi:hypothetical protein
LLCLFVFVLRGWCACRYELKDEVEMFVAHVKIGEIPPQIQRKPAFSASGANAGTRVATFN